MMSKVWESVRSNNGIIVLLQLMETKVPITDADCIRGLACRAMAGLARSDTVCQIISKLPLFTNGQLQNLIRDPILQEKRAEHVQFQKYAVDLLERASGKSKASSQMDTSLANIHRANVVAQTRIQFNEQQLNELIYEHLVARGFNEAAANLQKEANLAITPSMISRERSVSVHHSPFSFRTPTTPAARARLRSKPSDFNALLASSEQQNGNGNDSLNGQMDCDADGHHLPPPIKLIKKMAPASPLVASSLQPGQSPASQSQRSLQKQISAAEPTTPIFTSIAARVQQPNTAHNTSAKQITLETIITEYLTNQHALCEHPITTCPQFDLKLPHKCPRPNSRPRSGLTANVAARHFRQQAGFNARRLDRHLIHSNFCVARTIRPEEEEFFFTCCEIAPCATSVVAGSYGGAVRVYNINESGEEFSYNCHDSFVNSIKCNRDGTLIATSSAWRPPLSALWSIENKQFQMKLSWEDEEYMEFANQSTDRILGTRSEKATIYDLHTGQVVTQFEPTIYNQYTKNRATYCPTDELILSDGVLWDVRSGREIHKFDKLNQSISGVFHPNGLEVSAFLSIIHVKLYVLVN